MSHFALSCQRLYQYPPRRTFSISFATRRVLLSTNMPTFAALSTVPSCGLRPISR